MKTTRSKNRTRSLCGVVVAALALGWAATVAAAQFPATGQTLCYDTDDGVAYFPIVCAGTGHDGDIQAGATLSYTDNGNGTVTDENTKLVWEKKSDDGSIHDLDNEYTWDDAFTMHVATLNTRCAKDETVTCAVNTDCEAVAGAGRFCGFARKQDWRLPNIKELQSIVNYQNDNPAVSAAFHNNGTAPPPPPGSRCQAGVTVLTGSCTLPSGHWSSTSVANGPAQAWLVNFFIGWVLHDEGKFNGNKVRAVRGGGGSLGPL